eukprot:TRINITY_DN89874_c0_g1_i1.p1 TRINITY_DN89874_c0_g1~~TRINITY_DN89874_c0_g1_i1.p1  ORF type:complete len:396 (-),score=52.82 TRINITY_DN89874_c0_g1_i1:93-1202(-)
MTEEALTKSSRAGPGYEVFDPALRIRNLPVVVFSDEADVQRVWHDGHVSKGGVGHDSGPPDVCAHLPVVMSPAYLGFAIEPYEARYLHFRDVGIVFQRPRSGRFMQPSIDTILVCRALVESYKDGKEVRRIIDVGSGSGLIGKFAGMHAPGSAELEVTLVDIDPAAKDYCESLGFNAQDKSLGGRPIRWEFKAQDAVALMEADKGFDLIVSNPPYIPTKSETRSSSLATTAKGFWEGISLPVFLIEMVHEGRCPKDTRLVMMVTSLTLKSPAVIAALEQAAAKGCRVRVLVEREIAWKAWYAGPSALDHLLATPAEVTNRRSVAGCNFYIGATEPGESRTGENNRDRLWGYHWHVAYVLEVSAPDLSPP